MYFVYTYLALISDAFLVAIDGTRATNANLAIAGLDASPFREILFSLLFSNFNLLFLPTATELIWLERVIGLVLGSPMLWDIALRHGVLKLKLTRAALHDKRFS